MRDKRVYIAAPYTSDPVMNTRNAIMAAEEVLKQTNWLPFVPHLFHLWYLVNPHPYTFWASMDADWLLACDALVRVGGESGGANADMDCAIDLGIPVFIGLDEFIAWTKEEA